MIGKFVSSLLWYSFFYGISCTANATDSTTIELNENQIKAIYLFKFATHIEWPSSAFSQPDTPFTIGIVGSEPIATELLLLSTNQKLANRPIIVKTIKHKISNDELNEFEILFISKENSSELETFIERIQSKPVLIVTETAEALKAGSIVNFIPIDEHLRFEISLINAERNQLKIGSRLLSVAQKVEMRSQ